MSVAPATRPRLERAAQGRLLGGVAAGIAQRLGVDPIVVRLAFVVTATAGGAGVLLYVLLWVGLRPQTGAVVAGPARRLRPGRAAVEVGVGAALLAAAVLLGLREAGLWFADALSWPVILAAGGGALLWRAAQAATEQAVAPAPTVREPTRPGVLAPRFAELRGLRTATAARGGLGLVMVLGAGFAFLWLTGALGAARDALLPAVTLLVVLAVVLAPVWTRLVRTLAAERDGRIRSQERAELSAHIHDSVLQTLALVQQRADDPRAVTALARRQERELRGWLNGDAPTPDRLSGALALLADEVEQDHGVAVEVVAVGDAELDERGVALVAAVREAVVNAAKFGGGSSVDVYAEAPGAGVLRVFVRDRGPGFDPDAVPADRRGVRESILGRMERHGGHAVVHSAPGAGTEVELTLGEA